MELLDLVNSLSAPKPYESSRDPLGLTCCEMAFAGLLIITQLSIVVFAYYQMFYFNGFRSSR